MGKDENNTNKTIGVMIGDAINTFSMELMNGINDAANNEGVQLLYMMGMQKHAESAGADKEHEAASRYNSIYDYINLIGADAYIISYGSLTGFQNDHQYQEFMKRFEGSVYVTLQKNIDIDNPKKSSITIDNYHVFCQCIEHLIKEHSYKKIALVAGPKEHPEVKERIRAYLDTMEKHGLLVTGNMITYGDLSEFVGKQVSQLLNDHPDLEAIAFCNDEMAKGGYKECTKRGLTVGKDIAITGFDNLTTGRTIKPPLTTVSQNTYQMGRLAVMQAIAMADGKHVDPIKLTTQLRIRNSCGCASRGNAGMFSPDIADAGQYVNTVIGNIYTDLKKMYTEAGQEQRETLLGRLADYILSLVLDDPLKRFDEQILAGWLKEFAKDFGNSVVLIAERVRDYLTQMPEDSEAPSIRKLYKVMVFIQGFLFSYELRAAEKQYERFRTQSWFIPELIRDLVVFENEDERVLRNVVERLYDIALDSVYICLLPEPQVRSGSGYNAIPEQILLAAYQSGGVSQSFPRSRMPVIDAEHTLCGLPGLKSTACLMSFSIFSGDVQYGILLCEADHEKTQLLHVIGLQLGILINFLDLKRKEKIVESELEHTRERNEILNFLSEYDHLSGLLNRRGFIERAIHLNRNNIGKPAICVFIDIDHLKEINDTFGHSEGDIAISVVSDILKKTVRSKDLIARIGGDEFVGVFIEDKPDFKSILRTRLRQAFDEYNNTSGHPYYIEASVGIACFTCDQGLEISKIINDADQYLYGDKVNKRSSVLK